MDAREQRVKVFQDTMAWIQEEPRLAKAVEKSKSGTRLYSMDETPALPPAASQSKTPVRVTKSRTFEAAMRLKREHPGKRVAVLNFASATNPGGGVERGSSAQEEALCRCSTLFPCLNIPYLKRDFYGFHRARHDVRYTDTCIYTPDVLVIKTDTAMPERMPEKDWTEVDVISCAAPNLREQPYNSMNPGIGDPIKVTEREQLELHKNRAQKILSVAADQGVDILVLGAFGCGAFRNNPNIVALAYRDVIPEFAGYFDEIEFAVYCALSDTANYEAFTRVLGQRF